MGGTPSMPIGKLKMTSGVRQWLENLHGETTFHPRHAQTRAIFGVPSGRLISVQNHGWPSPQAKSETKAGSPQAKSAQAEYISVFHQITRACI